MTTPNTANSSSAAGQSYDGKAKRMLPLSEHELEMYFKDDATAFNGSKHAVFDGKGALNCEITEKLLSYLGEHGIAHHIIARMSDRSMRVKRAEMFALEAVVRFKVAGSLQKRTGLPSNTPCVPPIVELYYKRDDLGDPIINEDHVRLLGLATPAEITEIKRQSLLIAECLLSLCKNAELDLVDMKFEFGKVDGKIILADEISPDTCRFRDASTGRILDKDLFRQDGGDLLAGYREVLKRLDNAISAQE